MCVTKKEKKKTRKKLLLVLISSPRYFFCFSHLSLHDLASHCWGSSAPVFGNVLIPANNVWKRILTTCLPKETHIPSRPTQRQGRIGTYTGGLEDMTWRYSSILPGWGDSLPGFPEPAKLELEKCTKAWVLCPAASPAAVQVIPAPTLLLGPWRRTPSASVPANLCAPFYPCLQEGLKIVTERYPQSLHPVGTRSVDTVKPECPPSRSWSVLRRLLGRLVAAPDFPYTGERQPGSQRHPWPPHTDHRVHELGARRICYFLLREPDILSGKWTLFIKEVKPFFSIKPLCHFHFSFKHLGGKVFDQNHCVLFSYSAYTHVENRYWRHHVQIISHWLYSQGFYNCVIL